MQPPDESLRGGRGIGSSYVFLLEIGAMKPDYKLRASHFLATPAFQH